MYHLITRKVVHVCAKDPRCLTKHQSVFKRCWHKGNDGIPFFQVLQDYLQSWIVFPLAPTADDDDETDKADALPGKGSQRQIKGVVERS